ncbi:MAG: hypothetical protein R3B13_39920 [Polyangiaceae bacterium]
MRLRTALGFCACLVGCGAGAPPQVPPSPAAPAAARKQKALTSRGKLARALLEIEAADVTAALPTELRKRGEAQVGSLMPEQRKLLVGLEGARQRPLLHLLAGGSSAVALVALATSRAASDELLALAATPHLGPEVIRAVREVSQRAARAFLRASGVSLSSPEKVDSEFLTAIDRSARTLDRIDLRRQVRELLVEVDPKPEHWLNLAAVAAWQLDVDTAKRALDKAGALDAEDLASVRASVAAAELVRKRGKPPASGEQLAVARALVLLGRHDEAKELLAARLGEAEGDLELAAVIATAELHSVCPSVPEGVGNEIICANAWLQDPGPKRAIALLEKAWRSGGGRSEQAVETYLGLAHVIPWTFATLVQPSGSVEDLAAAFRARLTGLSNAATEAAKVAKRFKGAVLVIDVLTAAFEASVSKTKGSRTVIAPTLQRQMLARADELLREQPKEPLAHAAVLAVAASLAQERDVLPLIDGLPSDLAPEHRLVRDVLRLWYAVGRKQVQLGKDAISGIASLVPQSDAQALERARLVLLMAEASAALSGSASDYRVLVQVTKNLVEPGVPPELRLRAVVDRAGALAQLGEAPSAAEALAAVVGSVGEVRPGSTEADLLLLAKTYLLALRARASSAEERADYAQRLTKVLEGETGTAASVRLFHLMWTRDVAALVERDKCGKAAACEARAAKRRQVSRKETDDTIGVQSGNLLRAGILPAGTLSLSFNYSSTSGLEPVVRIEPRLLSMEIPQGLAR